MTRTKDLEEVSTKLGRIAEIARKYPDRALSPLSHFMNEEWMVEAYRRTRKDGAVGVDGRTSADYERDLRGNLRDLLDRAKSGDRYRAPPVRRVHIPKGNGRTRPIGIPTFEDKVLQRAVAMVMGQVYEQDFYDCSYGFRPGRSAHQAIDALWRHTMDVGGGWVLEADIESFFDTVDHRKLQEIVGKRIKDGVLRRLIGKWLKAGVMEEGRVRHPKAGTPQGGVISPLMANVYLHEALDEWFTEEVKPRLRGRAYLVRYADDATLVFEHEDDARRVMAVLGKRLAQYGLRLHPDKTRLVDFRRPGPPQGGTPERRQSLRSLGFTLHWGVSRKGNPVVRRKTDKKAKSRTLKAISQWLRRARNRPVAEQHLVLVRKLRGHYGYFGVTGNISSLQEVHHHVRRIWHYWLGRRSQRAYLPWPRMLRLLERYPLPAPRIVHSYL